MAAGLPASFTGSVLSITIYPPRICRGKQGVNYDGCQHYSRPVVPLA